MIVLPWPDKRLTPNAKRRTHWRVYQPAIKADREAGCYLTYQALGAGLREVRARFKGDGHLPLTITFFPPDRRWRDDDGMIAAFKHLRDGMCDALGVNDRRFRPVYKFAEPEKPGRVEVVFLQVGENFARDPCLSDLRESSMKRTGEAVLTTPVPALPQTLSRSATDDA